MNNSPLYQLFEQAKLTQYAPGEIITLNEDSHTFLYCIQSGFVRVYSVNARGEEYLHVVYKEGELFPLVRLTGKVQRGVRYEALSNVSVHCIPRNELMKSIRSNSALSLGLCMQVMSQFNVYTDRLDNLQYKFGRERLVYRILFLASRFGRRTERGIVVDLPLTQRVLGNSINLSRETVARELRRLEDRGLVVYEDRKVLILNVEQLASELKGPINADFWGLK